MKVIKKALVLAIFFACRNELIRESYLWGLQHFPGLENRLQKLMIADAISGNANLIFFNRKIPQELCQEHNLFYFFVDHLVELRDNTGLQRVGRMLSRSFLELGKKMRFVKWDEKKHTLVYINSANLEHLGKWSGPVLSPNEAAFYSDGMMAGVEGVSRSAKRTGRMRVSSWKRKEAVPTSMMGAWGTRQHVGPSSRRTGAGTQVMRTRVCWERRRCMRPSWH